MKYLLFAFLIMSYSVFAQNDTLFFDSEWNAASKSGNPAFYRIIVNQGSLWRVEDYFINGNLQMSGFFSDLENETRENTFIFYDEKGKKTELTNYKNNLKHGKYESYFPNGNIELSQNWENGVKNGDVIFYYENGDIFIKGQYVTREKRGLWQFYDTFGKVGLERIYEKNVNISGVNLNLTMANDLWYSLKSQEQAEKLYLFFARDEVLDNNNNFVNPLLTIILEKDKTDEKLLEFALKKIQELNLKIVEDISTRIKLPNSMTFQIEYLNEKSIKIQGYVMFYKQNNFIASTYFETSHTTFDMVNGEFLEILNSIKLAK